VTARQLLAWALGLLPVVGLMTVGISALVRDDLTTTQLAVAIVVLGSVAVLVGGLLAWLSARATADPIKGLREATDELDRGDLEVEVPVYDGTEIGLLQAGFNRAVAGLRERERMRDLFGRHVGEEVARAALDRGAELGGEALDVAVLFADVVGSTRLAAERSPEEVVEVLNRFFGVVVDVVDEAGGYVDKFAGDAVLAVFGAPVPADDAATRALRAARTVAERLRQEVTDLDAGIGVAAGRAVAGNVGHARRLEYTVIGDPVNEAARLSDTAKDRSLALVASMRAVEAASDEEAGHWRPDDEVVLRGRTDPTRLAVPTPRRVDQV
jgi:adenylate cyclase